MSATHTAPPAASARARGPQNDLTLRAVVVSIIVAVLIGASLLIFTPERVFALAASVFGSWPRGADPFASAPIPTVLPLREDVGLVEMGEGADLVVHRAIAGDERLAEGAGREHAGREAAAALATCADFQRAKGLNGPIPHMRNAANATCPRFAEAARVDGPELPRYTAGLQLAPCIQFGQFNCTPAYEEEMMAWYARWRMPAVAKTSMAKTSFHRVGFISILA